MRWLDARVFSQKELPMRFAFVPLVVGVLVAVFDGVYVTVFVGVKVRVFVGVFVAV